MDKQIAGMWEDKILAFHKQPASCPGIKQTM